MNCLICEEEMSRNGNMCKMCGMGIAGTGCIFESHAFCSEICVAAFRNIIRVHGKRSDLAARDIVL